MTLRALCTATVLTAALLTGCGEEETAETEPASTAEPESTEAESAGDGAVEAQEQNTVELGGIRYRVVIFRQLNPRIAPDDALYEGPMPRGDRGVYAAFLQACNVSDETRRPAREIRLEDAFGEAYPQLEAASESLFDYQPARLRPDECVPSQDTAADRTFPGAAVLFAIPFDDLGNRPFVLELRDSDAGVRRIQLDL